jgi:hypothetical protein
MKRMRDALMGAKESLRTFKAEHGSVAVLVFAPWAPFARNLSLFVLIFAGMAALAWQSGFGAIHADRAVHARSRRRLPTADAAAGCWTRSTSFTPVLTWAWLKLVLNAGFAMLSQVCSRTALAKSAHGAWRAKGHLLGFLEPSHFALCARRPVLTVTVPPNRARLTRVSIQRCDKMQYPALATPQFAR